MTRTGTTAAMLQAGNQHLAIHDGPLRQRGCSEFLQELEATAPRTQFPDALLIWRGKGIWRSSKCTVAASTSFFGDHRLCRCWRDCCSALSHTCFILLKCMDF